MALLVHVMILARDLGRRRHRLVRPPGPDRPGHGRDQPNATQAAVRLTRRPFPHVFEPLTIRGHTFRSRINFGAHTANMAVDGLPGDRHIGYYRERALGGVGMIVVEPIPVHRTAVLTRGNFRHDDDSVIPAFRRLIDACREAGPGVVMIQQLYHVGQHGDADNSFQPNWSPSGPAVVPRCRWQPRDDRGRDRGGHRRVHRGRGPRSHRPGSTASRSSPRTTPWSTSSGRRGPTAGPTSGAPPRRTGCGSRRASSLASARPVATSSSSVSRSTWTPSPRRRCRSTRWPTSSRGTTNAG